MKAIIIAAGMGTRLQPVSEEWPKCLAIKVKGKTLFETQTETMKACGIDDIVVIKGYAAEKFDRFPEFKYYLNDNYMNNNILNSLMYAEEEMNDEVVITYSDIWYEKEVLERLLRSDKDIAIGVDIDWKEYYIGRKDHPIEEAENVIFDPDNRVLEIGKIVASKREVHGEFIGMMKLTKRGCGIWRKNFKRARQLFRGKPFQKTPTFEKAYLTDMLQDLVDIGVPVYAVIIGSGWKEIDTVEDYRKALKEFRYSKIE